MYVPTILFTIAIAIIGYRAEHWQMAIYALSFWHYLVYTLAFTWRHIPHKSFIQDSFLLKTMSLTALALVLWTTVPNAISALVMIAGFAINIAAVRALGADRTYYGYELVALEGKQITSFPYSVTAHPMLIGNMLAFGGTLLDEAFRQAWWPLGLLHVVLNLLIILMEAYGGESRTKGTVWSAVGLLFGTVLLLIGFTAVWLYALATIAVSLVFGLIIMRRYA